MAKSTGLDTRIHANGYDLSGDVSSLTGIGSNQALLDVTTLDLAATARVAGLKDGSLSCAAFFDNAASKGHSVWTSLSGKIPTADQNVLVPLSTTIGEPALMIVSKQGTYYVDRPTGGPITCSVEYQASDGLSPDFGFLLTGGKVTDSSGTTFTQVDGTAQSTGGARAMIQAFALTSGSATVTIQDSPDNVTYGTLQAFSTVTGSGITSEFIEISGTVERYVRLKTSGTFSTLVLCVAFIRL
jgi:hypothetical protein